MKQARRLSFILLLLLAAMGSNHLFAQISEGGTPPSFSFQGSDVLRSQKQPFVADIKFNVSELKAEDEFFEENNLPLRTSVIIPVDLSISKDAEWKTLPDGQLIANLAIDAPDAIATMLYYDEFFIPEGGKLFIYNADKTHVIGAYTSNTNLKGKAFATEFVAGDKLVLEYVAPGKGENIAYTKGSLPKIKISGIGYGYNYLEVYYTGNKLRTFNDPANSCMVNINCPEGDNWQDQKRGVAKSVTPINGGGWLCSGTIVNNTAMNLTPYFLTASHCFYDNDNVKCSGDEWNQIVYYFNYETAGCSNPSSDPVGQSKTMTGAELLVELPINGGSDGALLKLNNDIPSTYNVYYNGWDRSATAATSGVGIHHPKGDIKKISTYTQPATSATWNTTIGAPNAHWLIYFVQTESGHSVTEGGSSGSPMFNQDGRVVGTLTGGNSDCENLNGRNLYGKLWYHWDNNNIVNPSLTMGYYLDPLNTGNETLNGTYTANNEPSANFVASSAEIIVFSSVKFTNLSTGADTYNWTFQGGTPSSSTQKNPPVIYYNDIGSFEVKLVINKGTPDEKEASQTIVVKEKGDNPVAPIANFSVKGEDRLIKEHFEGTFPAAGWSIDNRGASSETWIKGNMQDPTPDPVSPTNAAYHRWDDNNVADAWLFTNTITIPSDEYKVEFYCSGGGPYHQYAWTYFYVIDASNNETELWNNGAYESEPNYVWAHPTIDLSAYAGQTVRFAWRYYGQAGDAAIIDGVKVYADPDPNVKITINVGEFISPTDLSSGPPILWDWTFDGGTPVSSTDEAPTIQYMTAGVYDVTLKVKNYRGEDTRTLEGAVTVLENQPIAAFETEGGYTRQLNYGLFVPTGASVNFMDKTENYPSEWNWTFDGATPSSSTEQNPQGITYNSDGEFALSFEAKNSAGSDIISVPDFTKVGYTTDRIWNMNLGEAGASVYTFDYGYVTGYNTYYHDSYAERFEAPLATGAISSVDIRFYVVNRGTGSLNVDIRTESGGYPGSTIATVALPTSAINTSGYTTVIFPEPVIVDGPFYVVVWYMDQTGNTFNGAITSSSSRAVGGKSTGYVFNWVVDYLGGQGWSRFDEVFTDLNISMNIVPEFTYASFKVEGEKVFNRKNVDATIGNVSVKSNVPWKAAANVNWIDITNESANGDGSFSFTVKDNAQIDRKAFIIVSAGEGLKEYILVHQAGPEPTDVLAQIITETDGTVKLDWKAPEFLMPDLFDDVESHTAFDINSGGPVGWSYIDGDGSKTWGIGQYSYPNREEPMAFQVFDGQAAGVSGITAHSGSQLLACFASNGAPNDDWLISPKLSYKEDFTFSFWAKSFYDNTYTEVIDVVYSTTGKAAADFTTIVANENINSPTTWNRYSYTIPSNATYVAIHCRSNDQYILMLDDIFIGTGVAPASMPANAIAMVAGSESNASLEKTSLATNYQSKAAKYSESELQAMSGNVGKTFRVNELEGSYASTSAPAPVNNILRAVTNIESTQLRTSGKVENALRNDPALIALRWDTGNYDGGLGLTHEDAVGEVAIRFTPTDLLPYHGAKMNSVEICLGDNPKGGIVTLNIRQGDQIIHTQQVSSLAIEEFFRISLSKEITINAMQDLYISYSFVQGADPYVAGASAGTPVAGKGDLLSINGSPFEQVGYLLNWNIALLVEDSSDATALEYVVYRDDVAVTTLTDLTYTDQVPVAGDYCYSIAAKYTEDVESVPTTPVCITINAATATDLTTSLDDNTVTLTWDGIYATSYELYRSGQLLIATTDKSYVDSRIDFGVNHEYCIVAKSNVSTSQGMCKTIHLPIPFTIQSHPVAQNICAGEDHLLKVEVTGDNVRYQWYLDGQPISEATESELVISNAVKSTHHGLYKVVVSNATYSYGEDSNNAMLSVSNPMTDCQFIDVPAIIYPNQRYLIKVESASGLEIDADNIQWSFSNDKVSFEAIEGEIGSMYLVTGDIPQSGTLKLELTNNCGVHAMEQFVNFYPTGIDDVTAMSIKLYPNPISEVLYISSDLYDITSIIVSDATGREIYMNSDVKSLGKTQIITTSSWTKGVYLVRVTTANGETIHKIIKN